jgi:fumarate hydratase class II
VTALNPVIGYDKSTVAAGAMKTGKGSWNWFARKSAHRSTIAEVLNPAMTGRRRPVRAS